jgi:hypothetical protein
VPGPETWIRDALALPNVTHWSISSLSLKLHRMRRMILIIDAVFLPQYHYIRFLYTSFPGTSILTYTSNKRNFAGI